MNHGELIMEHGKSVDVPPHPDDAPEHVPVLLEEVVDLVGCRPGGVYVDATLGPGGHAEAILERIQPDGLLLGVDRDRESLELARARLARFGDSARLIHDNFKNLPLILNNLALPPLDAVLVDLGISSRQLLDPERGFSFQSEAMLDMRMDRTQRQTAADLVNDLPESDLADLIFRWGEERFSRRIAAAIGRARRQARITRCTQLAEIVAGAVPRRGRETIHPATRTFQALRIAVNRELEGLEEFLTEILTFLRPGGRLVVISFHSLEDRIVKQTFRKLAGQCVCNRPRELCLCPRQPLAIILTTRPLAATPLEVAANRRARSAHLRAAERIKAIKARRGQIEGRS
jgi:16S rRNA (cytosine1402-N4)-methyltransferase